jgi:polyphosphate kinase
LNLAEGFAQRIHREAKYAAEGKPAHIIAKMNSLLEQGVIDALYTASQAGVSIDLIVRGICALRPGVKGLSENIRVRSVIGRFLEHSRIYYFLNGGEPEIYAGSADWMPRNLFERCEVVFPVLDPQLRQRIRDEILGAYLADTAESRFLLPSGEYVRARNRSGKMGPPFCAQEFLIRLAEDKASVRDIPSEPAAVSAAEPVAAATNDADVAPLRGKQNESAESKPKPKTSPAVKKTTDRKRLRTAKKESSPVQFPTSE